MPTVLPFPNPTPHPNRGRQHARLTRNPTPWTRDLRGAVPIHVTGPHQPPQEPAGRPGVES